MAEWAKAAKLKGLLGLTSFLEKGIRGVRPLPGRSPKLQEGAHQLLRFPTTWFRKHFSC